MKITALQNFKANGVIGYPNLVLTQEQVDTILPLKDEMLKAGLIKIDESAPPAPPEPEFEGIVDEGPGKDDELLGKDQAPADDDEKDAPCEPVVAPKSKKKKS